MRMTNLIIGEYYAWNKKRVKLLATGVVLKNYQHKGVQIEIAGRNATFIETVPAREIVSLWEDFQTTRVEWDRKEQLQKEENRKARSAGEYLRHALQMCNIDAVVTAYPEYILVSFDDRSQVKLLANILADQ